MKIMAPAANDTLEVGGFALKPVEWTPAQGRSAQPSPFLPIVKASVDNDYASYAFDFTLNGKNADERNADKERVIRALRRAGGQVTPPVTVMAQAGDVAKDGTVTITFKTREKITKAAKEAPAA